MKDYASSHNYKYKEKDDKFLIVYPSNIIQTYQANFSNVVEGEENGITFTMGYYDRLNSNNQQIKQSIISIRNKLIDLPCFYAMAKAFFQSNNYKVYLNENTNFTLIGRPEKVIKQLFTDKICEAVNRFFNNSDCEYLEGISEYLTLIYKSHLKPDQLNNLKETAIVLSSIFAMNVDFNTNHTE